MSSHQHRANLDGLHDRLTDALTEPLGNAGLDLEAVEISQAGRRRLLRVAVDKDGGVGLDDVTDATREVSSVLDATGVMGEEPYTLEVSSRGTDRPLTLPRHWRRNQGRLVKVALRDGRSMTGRIRASDDERADLDVDGTMHQLLLDEVAKARVQVELNRKEA